MDTRYESEEAKVVNTITGLNEEATVVGLFRGKT